MTLRYVDTSALVRAYLVDEPDHVALSHLLFDSVDAVVTSELALLEFSAAAARAHRAGRIPSAEPLRQRFADDCRPGGAILLLQLRVREVLRRANTLVRAHPLRTLDALHLAVALEDARPLAVGDALLFVTRDREQAAAAAACGLRVQ
ncbi:MAG: type II toxin-antitoxin system VapC family toxin [Egibacteraceae bacterium]